MKIPFREYHIWWQRAGATQWKQTPHKLKARTDKEAESKLRKTFAGAGFSGMSLVAVESGENPN